MLEAIMSPHLEEERVAFARMRSSLLEQHDGRYALISGSTLVGVFASSDEAYVEALRRFGRRQAFLIERIAAEGEAVEAPALALGVLDRKMI